MIERRLDTIEELNISTKEKTVLYNLYSEISKTYDVVSRLYDLHGLSSEEYMGHLWRIHENFLWKAQTILTFQEAVEWIEDYNDMLLDLLRLDVEDNEDE